MSPNAASLERLIQQARDGDDESLQELLTRCRERITDFAERNLHDRSAADLAEVVDRTLQQAAANLQDCETSEPLFQNWLEEICLRLGSEKSETTTGGFHAEDATLAGTSPPSESTKIESAARDLPEEFGGMETMVGNVSSNTKGGEAHPAGNELPAGHDEMQTLAGATGAGDLKNESSEQTQQLPDGFDSQDTMVGQANADKTHTPVDPNFSSEHTIVGGTAPTPSFDASAPRRFGKYELLSVIAKGGMGVVHKARDTKLNRIVAIKMILSGQFADEVEIDRFYTEAESAAKLRHANIVAIHEVGEAEGQHFFSMDFIDGQSLSDLIRDNPLSPKRAAETVRKIADAMQYAHGEGILHRDLKPSNVLLDQSLEPMITDFGLAKQIEGQSQLTMSGAIVGTPSYMPPEQASGKLDEVSVRSDVYSLGAVLYELATGRPLFRAANPFETIKQVLNNEPVPLRMLNPSVPVDLETICLKCLQKEPAKRYESAQELSEELARFLAGEPILARPVGPGERCLRWCRRNPKIAGLSAAVVLSLLLTVVVLIVSNIRTSAALADADESFRQARRAVDELFTKVSEDVLFNQPGMQHIRKDLLQQAMKYYERFLEQRQNDPKVKDELGETLFRMGQITEIIDSPAEGLALYTRARDIQQKLLNATPSVPRLDNLGDTWNAIGRASVRTRAFDDGLKAYMEAVSVRKQLVDKYPEHVDHVEFLRKLASSEMNVGVALREIGQAAEVVEDFDLADEQFGLALEHFETAQKIRTDALADAPHELKLRRDLGKGYYNLANLALMMRDEGLAEQHIEDATKTFKDLIEDEPSDLENQYRYANAIRRAADLRGIFGQMHSDDALDSAEEFDFGRVAEQLALAKAEWRAAVELEEQALQKMDELARNNPVVIFYKGDQAGILLNMGLLLSNLGDNQRALDCFLQARDILTPLVEQYPVPRYEVDLNEAADRIEMLQGA